MQIIKIVSESNGGHKNQTYHGILPEGWAFIPDELIIPESYPFVSLTIEDSMVTGMETNEEAWNLILEQRKEQEEQEAATLPTLTTEERLTAVESVLSNLLDDEES